jgi:hypothetical protein
MKYARRSSSDAGILSQLIGLHYCHEPLILDATWGGGRLWRGCPYQPRTRLDARQLPGVDVVGDWAQMPSLFAAGAFHAIVWDPPHQTDGGLALGGDWGESYGTAGANVRGFDNIAHLYPGFLEAARAVLQPEVGTLFCKIADQVHQGEQQLQAVDFVIACRAAGWTVCEMVPKMRQPGPMDPKWRRQLHVRKAWSYWICAHPGSRCPAVGVALVQTCAGCGRDFRARRSDARTCGDACRQRVRYRKNLTVSRGAPQQLSVRNDHDDGEVNH